MPSLQVRELPDPIYRKLSELAHKEHRSIVQQAVMLLAKSLDVEVSPKARRRQILDEIEAQSGELKKYSLKDPAEIIREERER
jgi:plasmid stability protein